MVHDINIRLIYIFYFCISCDLLLSLSLPFASRLILRFVCNLFTMLIKNAFIELHRQSESKCGRDANAFDENFLQFHRNRLFNELCILLKMSPAKCVLSGFKTFLTIIISMIMIINFVWTFFSRLFLVHFL